MVVANPMLDSPEDARRRSDLRRMKAVATGLLLFAAVVFVFARWAETEQSWAGYVRATAEAAMVGAIADWFAVTALFKHPLGLLKWANAQLRRFHDFTVVYRYESCGTH